MFSGSCFSELSLCCLSKSCVFVRIIQREIAASILGLPWWLRYKESTCNAGDLGLIPGLGRSPGGGHGN